MPEEKRSFVELLPDKISLRKISDIRLHVYDESGDKEIPCRRSNYIKYGMGFAIAITDYVSGAEEWAVIATPHVDAIGETTIIHFSRTLGSSAPSWARGEYKGSIIILNGGKGPITVVILKHPQ